MIDFGKLPQGAKKEASLTLTNPTKEPVEIAAIDSSCPCLEVQLPKKAVSPSEQISAKVLLDLSGESKFTGRLGIMVRAKTPEGKTAFELECAVDVERTSTAFRKFIG